MAVACPIRYLVSQSFHTRPELERFAASFLHAVFASTAKLFKAKKNARPLNGELEPLAEESYAPQAALLHRERLVDCPVHKPPFWAVKRPARPYKTRHTQPIRYGAHCRRLTARGGPGPSPPTAACAAASIAWSTARQDRASRLVDEEPRFFAPVLDNAAASHRMIRK
jgi:hypothetical protein